jgi:membrane-bound ClpP family serine protease
MENQISKPNSSAGKVLSIIGIIIGILVIVLILLNFIQPDTNNKVIGGLSIILEALPVFLAILGGIGVVLSLFAIFRAIRRNGFKKLAILSLVLTLIGTSVSVYFMYQTYLLKKGVKKTTKEELKNIHNELENIMDTLKKKD